MIKGLYIHIPFCEKICHYCDFPKMKTSIQNQHAYIKALLNELDFYQDKLQEIETIYIGGGTPSSLPNDLLESLLKAINEKCPLHQVKEFTIEANPSDVTSNFIQLIQKYNVSRLSIGVQSTKTHLLKAIGRTHTYEDIKAMILILQEHQFDNFNFDFIYGIPNQTMNDILDDLSFIQAYQIPHLSFYSLILEEKTILYHQVQNHQVKLLDEDIVDEMEEEIFRQLTNHRYHKYEISNYAYPGYESIHNQLYWQVEEVLGIGYGAASFVNQERYHNDTSLSSYLMSVEKNGHSHHFQEITNVKQETLLLGLRMTKGISILTYQNRFHEHPYESYPDLQSFEEKGLLEISDGYLRFTHLGMKLSNQVYLSLF